MLADDWQGVSARLFPLTLLPPVGYPLSDRGGARRAETDRSWLQVIVL